jgi:hypothetical protein
MTIQSVPGEGHTKGLSFAALDVIAERQRQIDAEGWTPEHDDTHERGEMARAAAAYAIHGTLDGYRVIFGDMLWPWAKEWWKPAPIKTGEVKAGKRRNLVKAGALILAEIERLDRFEAQP